MHTTQKNHISLSAQVAHAKQASIKHTSEARFCDGSVVAEASTAAVLHSACGQSAPIRRALHCVLDVENVRLMGQHDEHQQLIVTAVEAGRLPQLRACYLQPTL